MEKLIYVGEAEDQATGESGLFIDKTSKMPLAKAS